MLIALGLHCPLPAFCPTAMGVELTVDVVTSLSIFAEPGAGMVIRASAVATAGMTVFRIFSSKVAGKAFLDDLAVAVRGFITYGS